MAQHKGLAGVEVVSTGRRRGAVAALAEEAPSASTGLQMVPLAAIALNPDNPAARIEPGEDLEILVASIRRIGIVTPLTLTPAADFAAAHPEHVFGEGIEFVAVAGNRRVVAARIVELDEVPAAVRADLAALSDEAMLHENGPARIALTPIQEALGMDRLIKQGRTQADIAEALGVSQGQVAKRLQLLKLPTSLRALVDSKQLKLEDVPALVRADADVLTWLGEHPDKVAEARWIDSVLGDARRAIEHQAAVAAAEKAAAEAAVPFVANPAEAFQKSNSDWNWEGRHLVSTKKDIDAARKAGTLVVAPGLTADKPKFFTTASKSPAPEKKPESAEDQAARERRKARPRRMESLLAFAAKPVTAATAQEAALDMVLHRTYVSSNANDIVTELAVAAGIITQGTTYWEWNDSWSGSPQRLRIAYLAYLACAEARMRDGYHRWDERDIAYYDLLIGDGYQPGEWETEQLAEARTRVAKEAAK